jgi:large subunit ribosomal protein L25
MVQLEHNTISVEAEATHIPESVTISVEGLDEGAQIHAGELVLPAGTTLLSAPDMLVLLIQQPPKVEEAAPAADAGDAVAPAAAEGSGSDDGGE